MIRLIGNALLAVTACISVLCVLMHHIVTHGGWRKHEDGRHVMSFMAVLASVVLLWCARVFFPGIVHGMWFEIVRLIDFALVPLVMAWRLALIVTAPRRARRILVRSWIAERREGEPS